MYEDECEKHRHNCEGYHAEKCREQYGVFAIWEIVLNELIVIYERLQTSVDWE